MLFKDEAAALAARWRAVRTEDEIEDVAAQTAVALARVTNLPQEVLDALDGILCYSYCNRGAEIICIVRYVDSLALDREPAITLQAS